MKKKKPRERVLEVASKLFKEQGFNSTGINQILKDANVARASFYDHFASKDDLAVVYMEERHNLWFQMLNEFVNPLEGKEKIVASFHFIKQMNEKENFSGCVFLNMMSELKHGNEKSMKVIQQHKHDLQNYFESCINDKSTSHTLYMLFEACLVESQLFRDNKIVDKTIDIVSKLEL